jgi:hypothetical protein
LAGTTRRPELSLKLWADAHLRNLGSILNWRQGYGRRRAVPNQPTKTPEPSLSLTKAWHLSVLLATIFSQGSRGQGVMPQSCALLTSLSTSTERSPSPWHRDHELITQSFLQDAASSGEAITPPHSLKLAANQDSSWAICSVPCSESCKTDLQER